VLLSAVLPNPTSPAQWGWQGSAIALQLTCHFAVARSPTRPIYVDAVPASARYQSVGITV
jgi:hypothetical protein